MKRLVVAGLLLALSSGCLSVCRFEKLSGVFGGRRVWSEERQEYVWRKYDQAPVDILSCFGLYPTLAMRWQILRLSWSWTPLEYYWSRRVGIPVAELLLLPGLAVDVVVDTVSLPCDWKYRGRTIDMVSQEYGDKVVRSVCVSCGALSDGEFARCRKTATEFGTDPYKYYGVCPRCVGVVSTNGYYFVDSH